MKRTTILLAAASSLLVLSCATDVVSIQIKNAVGGQPDEACTVTPEEEIQKGGGSVDLGYTRSYMLALWLSSALDSTAIQAGGKDVQPGGRNDFYIKQVSLKYSGKGVPSIPAQVRPAGGTVPAGDDLFLGLDILTNDAVTRLESATIPPDGLNVEVAISFEGEFAHGATFETAPFVFPLTVWNNEPPPCDWKIHLPVSADPGGAVPACANFGQDNVWYACGCRPETACGIGCEETGENATPKVCDFRTCTCVAAQ